MTALVGCTSASDDVAAGTSAPRSGTDAAATTAPGTYGVPVDPALPDPTDVATDAPVTTPPSDAVRVVVTYSGWTDTSAAVEFGAYVAGVVEAGGTCTLTLTAGSSSASATVEAQPDASSTSCPMMSIAGTELSSGTWQAAVEYESSGTSGQSKPVSVTVP
ncbi:hypothetical protein [Modestobacter sp. VKM Ac-2985]|uniref:hypothetical protein n=1 Tax=Modestobacter sp. VKM Ac-2985 TaxID=3004139 RepID=UPI0022AB9C0B|nr:hypothetical protein [Modestobacter sp. VKM Ac-2985]MCZ2838574.1 hypothetical protein [Modestobacter sp. VKM Ac-2985]